MLVSAKVKVFFKPQAPAELSSPDVDPEFACPLLHLLACVGTVSHGRARTVRTGSPEGHRAGLDSGGVEITVVAVDLRVD